MKTFARLPALLAALGAISLNALAPVAQASPVAIGVSSPLAPRKAGSVAISGTPAVGQTLSVPAITGAAYQWTRGGSPISGAASRTYTTGSADAGTTLTCLITVAGVTLPSASVTVPSAPTLSATAGNAQAVLAWTDGTNGGATISSHKIYEGASSGAETAVATTTGASPYTLTGLTNGSPAYLKLSAVNSAGEGALSAEVSVTPVAATGYVSACIRCSVPTASGTAPASGVTSAYTWRDVEKSNVAAANLVVTDANAYMPATGVTGELASGLTACYRMAILTGITGGGSANTPPANQSAATETTLTFSNMLNNSAFVAAGGTVNDSGRYICVPSGMLFSSDPSGVSVSPQQYYAIQAQQVITGTGSGVRPLHDFVDAAVGDLRASGTVDNQQVYSTNWSVATGGGVPAAPTAYTSVWQPVAVIGTGTAKVVGNSGDSVEKGFNNSTFNSDGVQGFARAALEEAGYSYIDSSVPGSKPSDFVNTSTVRTIRLWLQQYASKNLDDFGLNDRGVITAWGNGAGDGNEWDIERKYDLQLAAVSPAGWSMVKVTMPPHTTDTAAPGYLAGNLTESGNTATFTLASGTFGPTFTGGGTISTFAAGGVTAWNAIGATPLSVSSTTITYTVATSGLTATTGFIQDDFRTQVFAEGSGTYPTGWQFTDDYPWIMGTGAYSVRHTNLGDPSAGFDAYGALNLTTPGYWNPAARPSTFYATTPGTHLTDGETLLVKAALKPQLSTLLGF